MVLVTGATGILGRVLVLELLKSGKKVRAAKRHSSNLQEVRDSFSNYTDGPSFFFKQIEWVDFDLNDCQSIAAALKGIDEVYHCAAKVSYDPADRREIIQVNVTGTINIVNCSKSSDVRKFLYVGSAAISISGKMQVQSVRNQKLFPAKEIRFTLCRKNWLKMPCFLPQVIN